jgi:hypothetical protein
MVGVDNAVNAPVDWLIENMDMISSVVAPVTYTNLPVGSTAIPVGLVPTVIAVAIEVNCPVD